jgi:serine/threonine-protein kinase RsbW
LTDSVISLPELDNAAKGAQRLTLRVERDLCYDSAHEVVSAVQYLLARTPEEIVIEIGKVNSVDSSGLRALVAGRNLCEAAGVGFRLDKISDCVARIVEMSGLSRLLGLPEPDVLSGARQRGVHLGSAIWKTSEHVASSDPALISVLRERITTAAEEVGATGEVLCDIKIAVGEALTNAYRHGSPTKGANKIQVRCMTCSSAFVVEIEDEGNPFNPDDTPEPDPAKLKDHGMGIFLMREAMDVVEFSFNCPGNRVRMVKWLRDG